MKFKALILILLLPAIISYATPKCSKQLKIGIVDTGLNLDDPRFKDHLCKTGHKNFVEDENINDSIGHGTFIAGIIQRYAENGNYCLLIYKYYEESAPGKINAEREALALQEAVNNKADIVNLSGGGSEANEAELLIIKNNPKITFVVAAGNEKHSLDIPGNEYYPASYFLKNERVVEATNWDGTRASFSNWGKRITDKEIGVDVYSYLPNGASGYMSGTSMATAIISGKLVDKRLKSCEYR